MPEFAQTNHSLVDSGDGRLANTPRSPVVTIDGPAGAGKSTVACRLAQRLGWTLLDTGAMYRCVALASVRAGILPDDDRALGELTALLRVELTPGRVLLEGLDVSREIRTPEISTRASEVAQRASVRSQLVAWQRQFAAEHGVVTEGRDQGTVVFPDALLKVFLTASPDERAARRSDQLAGGGPARDRADVLAQQLERDRRDASRAAAPMRPADDALIVDTSGLDIDQVVGFLEGLVRSGPPYPWEGGWPGDARSLPPGVETLAQAWDARLRRLVAVGRGRADALRAAGTTEVDLVDPTAQEPCA
jgi:cytidylate kinase